MNPQGQRKNGLPLQSRLPLGTLREGASGNAYRALVLGLAILAALVPYLDVIPGITPALGTLAAFIAVQLIGLNLIFGLTGMLAFGQAAFVALPGYFAGVLGQLGVPLPIALLAGVLATVLIARIVAIIFVRLPGIFLAVGTLGFAFVVEGLARAFPAWTGGASGLVLRSGRDLSAAHWYAISLIVLIVALGIYVRIARGAFLRTLRMVRHDELAAQTMGIDVNAVKVRVFTMGSAFSAVGGLFMAYYVGVLVPESAGVNRSLEQIGMLLLGGPGALLGPVLGGFLVNWLLSVAGYGARYELLIYGLAFLGAVMYARDGVAGLLRTPWQRLTASIRAPSGRASAPEPGVASASTTAASSVAQGPCLVLRGVTKQFGGLRALSDVGLSVNAGEIFTLVGPNGAGKSTLFNIISGIERLTAGAIELSGRDIGGDPIHRRAPGIGRSFQVARLVPQMTAIENVMVRLDQVAPHLSESQREAMAREQLLGFGLGDLADRPVQQMGIGQHKLIDLARAAIGQPPVVLLDEPAVGLTGDELEHLKELLLQLKARGCAVVIVEHNIGFVSGVAERGIVLDHGVVIAYGSVRQIFADPDVQKAYFGVLT